MQNGLRNQLQNQLRNVITLAMSGMLWLSLSCVAPLTASAAPGHSLAKLHKMLKSRDIPTRLTAAQELASLGGRGVPGMILALQDPLWKIRDTASKGLLAVGALHLPALSQALRHQHPRVRLHIAEMIGLLGAPAHRMAPVMHLAVSDREWGVRLSVVKTLASWALPASTPTLLQCLKDPYHLVRAAAIQGLAKVRSHHTTILRALTQSVSDSHEAVRFAAIKALSGQQKQISTKLHTSLLTPLFLGKMHDPSWRVRWAATYGLGQLGEAAKAAVPALKQAFTDDTRRLQGTAAIALGHIGAPAKEMIPVFIRILNQDDALPLVIENMFSPIGRLRVAMALRKRIPYLERLFAITRALTAFGKLAAPQLYQTLQTLRAPHPWFVFTLGCIGPHASGRLRLLLRWQQYPKIPNRWVLLLALSRIAPRDPRVVRALWIARKDSSSLIRIAAAKALIEIKDRRFRNSKAYATHITNHTRIHQAASNLLIVMRTRSLTPTLFFK